MEKVQDDVFDVSVKDVIKIESSLPELPEQSSSEAPENLKRNYNGTETDAVAVYKWLWRRFADDIISNKYYVMPTMTEFRRWLVKQAGGNKSKSISADAEHYINRYFPQCTSWVKALQADIINQGSAKKFYERTAAIFALKNMCGWSDNNKDAQAVTAPIQININVV